MSDIEISRRTIVAGLGTASLTAAIDGTTTFAKTTSHQKTIIGDIELLTISDGFIQVPTIFFPNSQAETLSGLGRTVQLGANVWIVKTGGRIVLVDAGSGSAMGPSFPNVGNFANLLAQSGITPGEITDVIVTHMHPDHIGGLITNGQVTYPNAVVHIVEDEWRFWTDEALIDSAPEQNRPIIQGIQSISTILEERVSFQKFDADLGNGLSYIPTPGHTPGHAAVRIADGDLQHVLIGDAIVSGAIQFSHPDTVYALDVIPDLAAKTRRSLFDMLAADKTMFSGTHLAFPGAGYVMKDDSGYIFSRQEK